MLIQVLSSAGKMDAVSQMPVVLLPIHFDRFFIREKHTLFTELFSDLSWSECRRAADLLLSGRSG